MYMVKSAVIFSDSDKNEVPRYNSIKNNLVTLTRDEYRKLIDSAYQEGRSDALKEVSKKEAKKKPNEEVKHEGQEEAIRANAKQKEENRQRLQAITARQDIEILRAESVFPFTIFTDTIIIDTTKISVSKKQLFATEFITTIPLKDLADVTVQTVLFLGTLIIKYMPQSSSPGMNEAVVVKIPNLKREDAIKAKNILKGALVAKAEEIDIARLSPEEVLEVLEKFGKSSGII